MGILIGLIIATVLAIGWGYGLLIVAVFLTLGDLFLLLLLRQGPGGGVYLAFVVALAVIWAPFSIRRHIARQSRPVVRAVHQFVDPLAQRPASKDVLALVHQERPSDWQ